MYVTYCKLCLLSSINTETVLDVCKPLQVMSFSLNSVNFLWLNLTKWTHMRVFWSFYSHVRSICSDLTTKIPSCGVHLFIFNHKN
ncbi:hypothetical protein Hanom_Chr01g00028051 [Helianthus anomalus]